MVKSTDFATAVAKLRAIQPDAHAIRRETCHCPRRQLMLSYRLPSDDPNWLARDQQLQTDERQTCGFFCAACGFSNAGSRPISWIWGDDA